VLADQKDYERAKAGAAEIKAIAADFEAAFQAQRPFFYGIRH
jgi:hypothetical protein